MGVICLETRKSAGVASDEFKYGVFTCNPPPWCQRPSVIASHHAAGEPSTRSMRRTGRAVCVTGLSVRRRRGLPMRGISTWLGCLCGEWEGCPWETCPRDWAVCAENERTAYGEHVRVTGLPVRGMRGLPMRDMSTWLGCLCGEGEDCPWGTCPRDCAVCAENERTAYEGHVHMTGLSVRRMRGLSMRDMSTWLGCLCGEGEDCPWRTCPCD